MIALATAASLGFHKTITPTAAAESDQKPAETQVAPAEPQPLTLLQTGMPQSTTATDTKPSNTFLTWTPTGVVDVQDVYDVRLSAENTPDPVTGELTNSLIQQDGLTTAQADATKLADGTYYWQVRSCSPTNPLVCNKWSDVWTLHVDAIAPADPTIEYTGAAYSQTVSFAGTTDANALVTVAVGDKSCQTNALADGTWSCTFKDEFDYGDYSATVKAADAVGNETQLVSLDFSVKELFVAPVITTQELPPALDIVPVDEVPQNKVFQQVAPTAVIDVVNTAADKPAEAPTVAPIVKPLSTDGGIVQSSENGWQVFGLPWFMWLGAGAGVAGAWWAFGIPLPRRFASVLSL